jgi:hypothetical protein
MDVQKGNKILAVYRMRPGHKLTAHVLAALLVSAYGRYY